MAESAGTLEIPPRGTRGARTIWGSFWARLFKPVLDMQIGRYRKSAGATPPKFLDFPLVLLTTKGARSGKEFTHPLGGFEQEDGTWVVVASKSGAATHPNWFINLCKNPDDVWLEIGKSKLKVVPTVLKGKEREDALARVVAISPRYGEYQRRTDREIPVIRLRAT